MIRPARFEDASVIARLILYSDCGLLPALFGSEVERLLVKLQQAGGNPFGFEHTIVAEANGVNGALVGYFGSATVSERLRTALLLARWYTVSAPLRFARLARAGSALGDLANEDYYISNFAVLPGLRGKGIGAALLAAAEVVAARGTPYPTETAPQAPDGARRILLDVDVENGAAQRFYFRHGFTEVGRTTIDLRRAGQFSLLRLAKRIGCDSGP